MLNSLINLSTKGMYHLKYSWNL